MRLTFFYLCLFLLNLHVDVSAQPVVFSSERLEIVIYEEFYTLKGQYWFENNNFNTSHTALFYPFVINDELAFPDSFRISTALSPGVIDYKRSGNGIIFKLSIPPQSTKSYSIFYKQPYKKDKIEYILTSTREWKKPLVSAEYVIDVPKNVRLKSISYEIDSLKYFNNYTRYIIRRNNFMPDKNLIIKLDKGD